MTTLRVFDPGLRTTVQDEGRFGLEHLGVARGGALDFEAFRWANRLAGNSRDEAVLENLLTGMSFALSGDAWLGVTGADDVRVDGVPRPPWSGFGVQAGARVELRALPGARCYVAVHGGIKVEPVLGSRSTNVPAGFGGWQGRALRDGDELPVAEHPRGVPQGAILRAPEPPATVSPNRLRLVAWSRQELFPRGTLDALVAGEYTMSPQSNEMGIRLLGPSLPGTDGDLLSLPMPVGGVQVPPSGQPILLLNGRGTVGGYPLLGTVATPDVWRMGQARPGDRVRFEVVSLESARSVTVRALRRLATAAPVVRGPGLEMRG